MGVSCSSAETGELIELRSAAFLCTCAAVSSSCVCSRCAVFGMPVSVRKRKMRSVNPFRDLVSQKPDKQAMRTVRVQLFYIVSSL